MVKRLAGVAAALGVAAAAGMAQAAPSQVARGSYIVNGVADCGDCHTPHGPNGPVAGKELAGTPLFFAPIHPMPVWADKAPRIAGLPDGYTRHDLVRLLTTGRKPNGSQPRPPMPQYRMTRPDAEAVAAYLASLKR